MLRLMFWEPQFKKHWLKILIYNCSKMEKYQDSSLFDRFQKKNKTAQNILSIPYHLLAHLVAR